MKALVKNRNSVQVVNTAAPKITREDDVLLQVALAGLCRTDIYAATGKLKVKDPLVLGHELAGVVEAVGPSVEGIKPGMRVTIDPVLRCRQCHRCKHDLSCTNTGFVGLDADGGFAEQAVVPAYAVLPLDDSLSFLHAAYCEPVAASLAVLKSGIAPAQKGAIIGKNRFSELLQLILDAYGFPTLPVFDLNDANHKAELAALESQLDYVIETYASSAVLAAMSKAIKPGGTMVLKSRQYEPLQFRLIDFLKKEPVMHVVNYGDFPEALSLLVSGRIKIDNLIDDVYALSNFEKVFERAQDSEAKKPFFDPSL